MIAASDPQEFIPSGRRQAEKHPGPLNLAAKPIIDNLLLDKLEKVSLLESNHNESWKLRKAPNKFNNVFAYGCTEDDEQKIETTKDFGSRQNTNKSYSDLLLDDSLGVKSVDVSQKFGKRLSDPAISRLSNKRVSLDSSASNNKSIPASNLSVKSTKFNCKTAPGYIEEELYIKGHTVIWSRGLINNYDNIDNARKTLCSYTSQWPVKHAIWCTFFSERPTYEMGENIPPKDSVNLSKKSEKEKVLPVPSICIVDEQNLKVFTEKGEDFIIAAPFKILSIWGTKFGIFLEREVEDNEKDFFFNKSATLYSLAYPLDDVCPVAVATPHLQILTSNNIKVVYTSEDPSFCMLYDSQTRLHSVYKIRKTRYNEKMEFGDKSVLSASTTNTSNKLKSKLSMWDNVKNTTGNGTPTPSLTGSRPASIASFCTVQHSKSHSSMATISRCQSPNVSSAPASPWLAKASRLSSSLHLGENVATPSTCSFFNCSKSMSHLRTVPNICLEHVWSENLSPGEEGSLGPASKVFLCDDLTGQWYLCYITSCRYLSMVRVDLLSNGHMSFGLMTRISAKDAVCIPHVHMLAILEHQGNVTLYSGMTCVGKLHIDGTLVQHALSYFVISLKLICPLLSKSTGIIEKRI